ncbi:MAG: hypothetical protein RL154_1235 [Pseudomonadota bacterium]|jgi:tryptophanyl-tRNA synthetase
MKKILSGIQSSGELHIGNYFGMIKRMIERQNSSELYCFIANYHAMTSLYDGNALRRNVINAATDFLALGIDPNKCTFWVQSDMPEVLELYWTLSNFTPMGLLERAHSYKDKTAKGISANHGLFSYPVLMAADILIMSTNIVPVGKDQIQHVEMARDIAIKFNNEYGDIFTIPESSVDEALATIPGIDGAKMSKSYGNTIEIFCSEKALKQKIGKIVTDSTALEEPKNYETCNVFAIAKPFLNELEQEELKARYLKGGEGYGHFKQTLQKAIWEHFAQARAKREEYAKCPDTVMDILKEGAQKARQKAMPIIEQVRIKTGIQYDS